MLQENNAKRKQHLKVFWEKDVFLKIAALKVRAALILTAISGEIAVNILKKIPIKRFIVSKAASALNLSCLTDAHR